MSDMDLFKQDAEMQDAIEELRQAQTMLDNAANKYRQDEAYHRMLAAEHRIRAIRYERGGAEHENANSIKLDFIRRCMRNDGVAGKGCCR